MYMQNFLFYFVRFLITTVIFPDDDKIHSIISTILKSLYNTKFQELQIDLKLSLLPVCP